MPVATLTAKDQSTIPAEVGSRLGLEAGSRVDFIEIAEDKYAIMPATVSVKDLAGILRKPRKPVTLEDMEQVAGAGRLAVP